MLTLLFEVMDKEPTVAQIWLNCLIFGVFGFVLCRYRAWLITPVFILLFCLSSILMPDNDESVKSSIIEEAGKNYYRYSYPALSIAILPPVIGMLLNVRRERKKQKAN